MKESKVEKVEELKLQIEELEERIAPGGFAPGLNGPGADAPPGESMNAPDNGGQVAGRWFGMASGRFGAC